MRGSFADYSVLPADMLAKVRDDAPFDPIWYVDKKIDLDSLVTHRLKLEQTNEGFELMKSGESIRSIIVL